MSLALCVGLCLAWTRSLHVVSSGRLALEVALRLSRLGLRRIARGRPAGMHRWEDKAMLCKFQVYEGSSKHCSGLGLSGARRAQECSGQCGGGTPCKRGRSLSKSVSGELRHDLISERRSSTRPMSVEHAAGRISITNALDGSNIQAPVQR